MFQSAHKILSHFIDIAPRFEVDTIAMQHGENLEDAFYLCSINDAWYVVYETDYINELSIVAAEATEIFPGFHAKPSRWLPKKNSKGKNLPSDLIFKPQDSYLRYAILEVSTDG